jgi:cytochrome c oxidase cbb3-type subunit 3
MGALDESVRGNASRIAEGGKLFIAYNCMDCHGAEGAGAMGPSLQDGRWHFGGTPGTIFQSIYEGVPKACPRGRAHRRRSDLAARRVRADVVEGALRDDENFTGKTIARSGH